MTPLLLLKIAFFLIYCILFYKSFSYFVKNEKNQFQKLSTLTINIFLFIALVLPPFLGNDPIIDELTDPIMPGIGKWAQVEKIRFLRGNLAQESQHEELFEKSDTIPLLQGPSHKTIKRRLPGIKGLINLYDSIYSPGDIENINIHLHYNNSLASKKFFTLAGKELYNSSAETLGVNVTKDIILNSTNFAPFENSTVFNQTFSNRTVPFVLSTQQAEGEPADIVLVTDLSNSMRDCMDDLGPLVPEEAAVTNNTVLLYNFNDDKVGPLSGQYRIYDSVNNLIASSSYSDRPIFDAVAGKFGGAFRYNQTKIGSRSSRFVVEETPQQRINIHNDLSTELWFKLIETSSYSHFLFYDYSFHGTVSYNRESYASIESDGSSVEVNIGSVPEFYMYATKNVNDQKYHHLALVKEAVESAGIGATMYNLYLDGELMDAQFTTAPKFETHDWGNLPLNLGQRWDDKEPRVYIDDFVIHNKSLTAEEVQIRARGYSDCPPDEQPIPDLELWLPMDNDFLDYSGNKHHGFCGKCPTYLSGQGVTGSGAYEFTNPNYLEIPHDDGLSATDAVSIETWFYPYSLDSGWRPIVTKFKNPPQRSNYWLGHNGGKFYMNFNSGGSWRNKVTPLSYSPNSWYHLVGIIDNNNDKVQLYINGTLVIDAAQASDMVADTGSLYIGWAPSQDFTNGIIDSVRIYKKVLTEPEVQDLFNFNIPSYDLPPPRCDYETGDTCPVNCSQWNDTNPGGYCYQINEEKYYKFTFNVSSETDSIDVLNCEYARPTACADPYAIQTGWVGNCTDFTIAETPTGCPFDWPSQTNWINVSDYFDIGGDCDTPGVCPANYSDRGVDNDTSSCAVPCPAGYCHEANCDIYQNCVPTTRDTCGFPASCTTPPTPNGTITTSYYWVDNNTACTETNCTTGNTRYNNTRWEESSCSAGWTPCTECGSGSGVCCCEEASLEKQCKTETEGCCDWTAGQTCYAEYRECAEGRRCCKDDPITYDCCSYGCILDTAQEVSSCDPGFTNGEPDYINNSCTGTELCKKVEESCVFCNYVKQRLARKVDKEFASIILTSSPESNISLVSYGTTAQASNFSRNITEINDEIDAYKADKGETCITCALNKSFDKFSESNRSRKYLILMSDGEANEKLDTGYAGNASQEAIDLACNVSPVENITIYSVAFGAGAGATTLEAIANCSPNGTFFDASSPENISEVYEQIASLIITVIEQNKKVNITGVPDTLYDDSYIEVEYKPAVANISDGLIPLTQEKTFSNCEEQISFNQNDTIDNIFLTGYSSNYWIAALSVENNSGTNKSVYNITDFSSGPIDFIKLGDPYQLYIPQILLSNMTSNYNRNFSLSYNNILGNPVAQQNLSNCSHNKLIYDAFLDLSTTQYSHIAEEAEGCNWTVQFPDNSLRYFMVPSDGNPNRTCSYTNTTHNLTVSLNNTADISQRAFFLLLDQLDIDNNGVIDYYFDETAFDIDIQTIEQVPYMWGPGILEVSVWLE